MKPGMIRCFRCEGRKRLYKVAGAYSHINTGGAEIDCPMCLGKGEVETLEAVTERGKKKLENQETITTYTHTEKPKPHRKKSAQVDIEELIEEC